MVLLLGRILPGDPLPARLDRHPGDGPRAAFAGGAQPGAGVPAEAAAPARRKVPAAIARFRRLARFRPGHGREGEP